MTEKNAAKFPPVKSHPEEILANAQASGETMKAKPTAKGNKRAPAALKALRRAAKKAVELARLTGTPAYVMKNGKIVDAAKRTGKTRKIHGKA